MIFAKVWTWLTGRAVPSGPPPAVSYVPSNFARPVGWSSSGSPLQPLERKVEIYSISGLKLVLGQVESRYRSIGGELVRHYEDCRRVIGTCGHPMDAAPPGDSFEKGLRHRGIGGLCHFCLREYQPLVAQGRMDPLEAERLSMVCTDCAQMSTSGLLCCPRHRKAMVMPDGTTQYIDPDAAKSMVRQNTITKALHTVTWLLTESQNPHEPKVPNQE